MKASAAVEEKPAAIVAAQDDATGGSLATAEDSSLCSSGEWGAEDLAIPYLSIVHNTGKLKKEFPVGSWVLDKSVVIAEENNEFEATVVRMEKYFREQFDTFDANNMPRQFKTEAEAQEAGLVKHVPRSKKDGTYAGAAVVDWLVECPIEHALFEYNGKPLTRCRIFMQGSAYPIAKQVFTASVVPAVKGAFYKLKLGLSTTRVESETNDWPEPRLKRHGLHDPEFIQWVEENVL